MSVNEAKAKFEEAKKAVASCQRLISGLTKKYDELLAEIPILKSSVERSETGETAAFDKFVLGQITQKELDLAKNECKKAKINYEDSSKMLESLGRGIKKTQNDLQRLNAEAELSKRQCWQAVADEIRVSIHSEVFENVQKLFVIGSQCGQTRSWLLDSLFPNIPTDEFQRIRNELVGKYGID